MNKERLTESARASAIVCTHQRIAIITHEHEGVDRRGVICHANSVHRPVLGVVVEDHRRDRVREKVEAVYERHSNDSPLRVAVWQAAHYRCTERKPVNLEASAWMAAGEGVKGETFIADRRHE